MRSNVPSAITPEQSAVRARAQRENIRAIQGTVQQRTRLYQRLVSPRMSLLNGRMNHSAPIMRR